jgi:hypothetical protein
MDAGKARRCHDVGRDDRERNGRSSRWWLAVSWTRSRWGHNRATTTTGAIENLLDSVS